MAHVNPDLAQALLDRARQVMAHAYAPYSQFPVGAALRTPTGEVFTGCNVENASIGLTTCAERNAIAAAVSHGHRDFEFIAITANTQAPTYPCGVCRQVLREFAPDLTVILPGPQGPATTTLAELLPHSFGPEDLAAAPKRDTTP